MGSGDVCAKCGHRNRGRMEYCATCGCKCEFALSEGLIQPKVDQHGQELSICKHCGHEIVALSEPPYNRNWVHRNPHRSYPTWCVLETKAEPSNVEDNVSVEAADAYLRGQGVLKRCEVCGQDATLTNNFVTHLVERHAEVVQEREAASAEIKRLENERNVLAINGAGLYSALKHALQTKHDIRTCACVKCENARAAISLYQENNNDPPR